MQRDRTRFAHLGDACGAGERHHRSRRRARFHRPARRRPLLRHRHSGCADGRAICQCLRRSAVPRSRSGRRSGIARAKRTLSVRNARSVRSQHRRIAGSDGQRGRAAGARCRWYRECHRARRVRHLGTGRHTPRAAASGEIFSSWTCCAFRSAVGAAGTRRLPWAARSADCRERLLRCLLRRAPCRPRDGARTRHELPDARSRLQALSRGRAEPGAAICIAAADAHARRARG